MLAAAVSVHCSGGDAGGPVEPGTPAPVAGEGAGAGEATPPPQGALPDTGAPAIVSITPANGTKGVRSDAKIVVKFSEPMDRASAEAAYASASLPVGAVTLSWNGAGTELTITPTKVLSYDVGLDIEKPANQYAIAIGAGAKDLAGNALAAEGASKFSTLRELFTAVPLRPESSGRLTLGFAATAVANLDTWYIGDSILNGALSLYFTFDLNGLPAGAEVTQAVFATRLVSVVNTPFADLGGHANLARVSFTTFDGAALKAAAPADIAPLSTTPDLGPRELDVTAAVADDVAKRVQQENKSQFRLAFPTASDGNADIDRANFLAPELGVKYLAP